MAQQVSSIYPGHIADNYADARAVARGFINSLWCFAPSEVPAKAKAWAAKCQDPERFWTELADGWMPAKRVAKLRA